MRWDNNGNKALIRHNFSMTGIFAMVVSYMLLLFIGFPTGTAFAAEKIIKMSTTTSTQASGLLDVLLPEFEMDSGIKIKVIAKGTGAAIRDGVDGNVDVIFVHAKGREQKFVQDGYGTKRYAVMHNDFVLIGPPADPAGIKGTKNVIDALTKISESGSLFISRGDDSGTHTKEQELWKLTGLIVEEGKGKINKNGNDTSVSFFHPTGLGKWYLSVGQGMGKTITFADEKGAYTLADRGTYIKYMYGSDLPVSLVIMSEGDNMLANPYGVIPVNPARHPHVQYEEAKTFAEWLVSAKGQKLIGGYKLLDKQLFFPDAVD